ncbi:MAG: Loki-CTERM sorting domain-containing protein [Candidatus Magasanikbacteria bacterium]
MFTAFFQTFWLVFLILFCGLGILFAWHKKRN